LIGVALGLALWSAPQTAPMMVTGVDLVRNCGNEANDTELYYCYAYLAGVMDAADAVSDASAGLYMFCVPPRTMVGQVAEDVAAYVAERADLWTTTPGSTAVVALIELYPCQSGYSGFTE
jgi:hypothetical protein